MGISVEVSQLERALAIVRDSEEYRAVKVALDEYFPQDDWADIAETNGPFALAFTRNSETEGGWLPQGELDGFWAAVASADPERPSQSDDLHRLLLSTIAAWQGVPAAEPGAEAAGYQNVTDMAGANYAGWQQGYDPDQQAWKYRDPSSGQWRESHLAFPPVAPGSRIFRIGDRTFRTEGDGEHEVWPHPDAADDYYDTNGTYDLMGNAVVAAEEKIGEPVDQAELERELRELFEIPPDTPMWVSPS